MDINLSEKPRVRYWILLSLVFIGFVISIYQTMTFYELRAGQAGFESVCTSLVGGDGAFDCHAIEMSRYAELFSGLPLSAAASGFFLTFIIILGLGRSLAWRKEAIRASFLMSAVGTLTSIIYLLIMTLVIQKLCFFCLIIDLINFTTFGLVLSIKPQGLFSSPIERDKLKTFSMIAAACFGIMALASVGMNPVKISKNDINLYVMSIMNSKVMPVQTDDHFPSVGPKDAKVTIVKFSDFQCPACRNGAYAIHPLIKRYPNDVRFVFRNFPLSPDCNRKVDRAVHPVACPAAYAAYCANEQGKYLEAYEALFENQEKLTQDSILTFLKEKGIDVDKVRICMESPQTKEAIAADVEEAIQLNVGSTPTFFMNGKRIPGSLPTNVWMRLIEEELKK